MPATDVLAEAPAAAVCDPVARWPRLRVVALHASTAVVLAVVWLTVGPVSGPYRNHVAELVGLEAVWLMSSSVAMLTRSRRVERAVGGVEVELWWHRLAGALGIVLGFVHPRLFVPEAGAPQAPSPLAGLLNLLSLVAAVLVAWAVTTPTFRAASWRGPLGWLARRGYDRWRSVHSLLFVHVVVAMAHGVVDSRSLARSPLLLVTYAAVCAVGLAALVERLLVVRRGRGLVGATVRSVDRFGDGTVVLRMLPDRRIDRDVAQWAELDVPASGERPHPFTVVSTPDDPFVELAVAAAGEGTARIVRDVAVGDRVRVGAVRGLPDAPSAGPQVWVASGIGVTPFVARLRALAGSGATGPVGPVDLVWTRRGFDDAPYVEELLAADRDLPWFSLHLHDTTVERRLTGDAVLARVGADAAGLSVLACGSPAAVGAIVDGLVAVGVPRRSVRTEAFGFR